VKWENIGIVRKYGARVDSPQILRRISKLLLGENCLGEQNLIIISVNSNITLSIKREKQIKFIIKCYLNCFVFLSREVLICYKTMIFHILFLKISFLNQICIGLKT